MNIDQVIVMGFIIVIFIAVFVFSMDVLTPLYTKLEFDEICRMFILMAEANNGLSESMKLDLEQALMAMDLIEISIKCNDYGMLKRGEVSEMEVEAVLKSNQFDTLFKRSEKSVRLIFKQNFIARKIIM